MADNREKRFQRIMDKLYKLPESKLQPPSGAGDSSSRKRAWIESTSRVTVDSGATSPKIRLGLRDAAPQPCRPWNRGDLMRRLATFKAMTWFGKPKPVNPVNCARRGWVNVEMDTIACEACGSRILFSTPSSWTFEQVEKTAAVFSLKLDNGHKLLCPWIDNICDESLASFPPTPAPELVEAYRGRRSALLQLSALPIISQSTLDYMKCEQLDNLLAQSSPVTCTVNDSVKLIDSSSYDCDVTSEAKTSNLYFESEKVIGLCGWEVRALPYTVSCENSSVQNGTEGPSKFKVCRQSLPSEEKNDAIVVYTENGLVQAGREKKSDPSSNSQYDPASSVLDCKLCGACVGLWAFDPTPCPLECFTLIDSPEGDSQNSPITEQKTRHAERLMSDTGNVNLKLSIAGGSPPTRQPLFRPRISLPIISRHLRSELGLNHEVTNSVKSDNSVTNKLNSLNSQVINVSSEKDNVMDLDPVYPSEAKNSLKRTRNEEETRMDGGDDGAIPQLNKDVVMSEGFSGSERNIGLSYEGRLKDNQEKAPASETDCMNKCESSVNAMIQYSTKNKVNHDAEKGLICTEVHATEKPNQSLDAETTVDFEECGDALMAWLPDIGGQNDSSNGGSRSLNKHNPMDIPSHSLSKDNLETAHAYETECIDKYKTSMDVMNRDIAGNEVHHGTENVAVICIEEDASENPNHSLDTEGAAGFETCKNTLSTQFSDISGQIDVVHHDGENGAIWTGEEAIESPHSSLDAEAIVGLEPCGDLGVTPLLDVSSQNDTSYGGNESLNKIDPMDTPSFSQMEGYQEPAHVSTTDCMEKSDTSIDAANRDSAGKNIHHGTVNGGTICMEGDAAKNFHESLGAESTVGFEVFGDDLLTLPLDISGQSDTFNGGSTNLNKCDSMGIPSCSQVEKDQEMDFVNETDRVGKSESSVGAADQDSAPNEVYHGTKNVVICTDGHATENPSQSLDSETIASFENCGDVPSTLLLDVSGQNDASNGGNTLNKNDPMDIPSCSQLNTEHTDDVIPDKGLLRQKSVDANANDQSAHHHNAQSNVKLTALLQETGEQDVKCTAAERRTAKTFDPITHHRPFCPWIANKEKQYPPGWKLTLLAWDQLGGTPSPAKARRRQFDESEDPIMSIRKLFESPLLKKSRHS